MSRYLILARDSRKDDWELLDEIEAANPETACWKANKNRIWMEYRVYVLQSDDEGNPIVWELEGEEL